MKETEDIKTQTYCVYKFVKKLTDIFVVEEKVVVKDGFLSEEDALKWCEDQLDKADLRIDKE